MVAGLVKPVPAAAVSGRIGGLARHGDLLRYERRGENDRSWFRSASLLVEHGALQKSDLLALAGREAWPVIVDDDTHPRFLALAGQLIGQDFDGDP